MLISPLQFSNGSFMLVTLLGILILLRFVQFANEARHTLVTPEGIEYELSVFPAG